MAIQLCFTSVQIALAVTANSAETEFGLPIAELFITNNTETATLRLITNVSDTEVVISRDLIMNGPFYNQIVMFCNASYPVEWAYEGDGVRCAFLSQYSRYLNTFLAIRD